MYLKSLTVRGFKSFASATTFEFFPGVTAVVGPNGSGKSNVIDALSWVMGEQGAKTLRGGKMEDVIFAGTSGRAPLGRAQVSLTIDNSDGALPIEYSEVTISRTLFRAGGSEYAINGEACRLLDIQELLSDSGLGKEMHVIVGQGQLDRILHATPEDRRAFIEEAAGILKHRRRKEKTVRKLEAMQANLARLGDLTAELRKQLSPLGKQAAVAKRAQYVQRNLRDAKARLLADDLSQLLAELDADASLQTELRERGAQLEEELERLRARARELETLSAQTSPRLAHQRNLWYELSSVQERLRALGGIATERASLLGREPERESSESDPGALERQAERLRDQLDTLQNHLESQQTVLAAATEQRNAAEEASRREDMRVQALQRAEADRREKLARLAGHVSAARARLESTQTEIERLHQNIAEAQDRGIQAKKELDALLSDEKSVGADTHLSEEDIQAAQTQVDQTRARRRTLETKLQDLEKSASALQAREGALTLSLEQKDGTQTLLENRKNTQDFSVLGKLRDLVRIESGYEVAASALLGPLADALVMNNLAEAERALRYLRDAELGRASVLLGSAGSERPAKAPAPLPQEARWAQEVIQGAAPITQSLADVLADVVIFSGDQHLPEAVRQLLEEHPELRAVSLEGDVYTRLWVTGGSDTGPNTLTLHQAREETRRELSVVQEALGTLEGQRKAARQSEEQAAAKLAGARKREESVRRVRQNAAQRVAAARAVQEAAEGERARLQSRAQEFEGALSEQEAKLADLTRLLAEAENTPVAEMGRPPIEDAEAGGADAQSDEGRREQLANAAAEARAHEVEARLGLRSAEEQAKNLQGRITSLERAAANERAARAKAQRLAQERAARAERARRVSEAVDYVDRFLFAALQRAEQERELSEQTKIREDTEIATTRSAVEKLTAEWESLREKEHREELSRAQLQMQTDALQTRSIDELGISVPQLLAEFGPDQPVPDFESGEAERTAGTGEESEGASEVPAGIPYVRAEQEQRLRRAERDLSALGKVNPLALEEFAALEERHQFLANQLEDLKNSRKDLLSIIKDVDRRVVEIFSAAWADTAEQFQHVFATLFPGGEGRLVLTDPSDMLTSGVEVEARPAGKKIKRLSLLSGGERSLTAVALLVAIFKARPSPFYVMDEVEAALDDTNLGRLLTIFEELRESSQLIIITHQKRTMEIADALYGVSMRGDGISKVVSQKLETHRASPPSAAVHSS